MIERQEKDIRNRDVRLGKFSAPELFAGEISQALGDNVELFRVGDIVYARGRSKWTWAAIYFADGWHARSDVDAIHHRSR